MQNLDAFEKLRILEKIFPVKHKPNVVKSFTVDGGFVHIDLISVHGDVFQNLVFLQSKYCITACSDHFKLTVLL